MPVLNWLVNYAEQHFEHEEALMRDCGYPRLAYHQSLHERLYTAIFVLNEDLALGRSRIDFGTLRFLKNWLLDHILCEDMDVGDFVRRKASQADRADLNSQPKEQRAPVQAGIDSTASPPAGAGDRPPYATGHSDAAKRSEVYSE